MCVCVCVCVSLALCVGGFCEIERERETLRREEVKKVDGEREGGAVLEREL